MVQRLYKYSENVELFDKTTNKMFPDDIIQKIQSYYKSSVPYKKARCYDCGNYFRYYPAHVLDMKYKRKNKKTHYIPYVDTFLGYFWCYYCTLQKQVYGLYLYDISELANAINIRREVRARKKYKKRTVESLFLSNPRLKYNGDYYHI